MLPKPSRLLARIPYKPLSINIDNAKAYKSTVSARVGAEKPCSALSLVVGEDGKQTFEASMMTAEEPSTTSAGTCVDYCPCSRNTVPDSTVSIIADITHQPVGELCCA